MLGETQACWGETQECWGEIHESTRKVLPDGIDLQEPGTDLAASLEEIDPATLNGHELVLYLQALWRQRAHLDALVYRAIFELAHTPPGDAGSPPERIDTADELIADELSLALRLTNRSSHMHLDLAFALERLPAVFESLLSGRIDIARARVVCEETTELDADDAREMAQSILGEAPELTTGQLGRRLRRRVMAKHPDAARRRYRQGVADRKIEGRTNPDGTADLLGRQLPVERVGTIMNRIEELARRHRRQGDDRPIDQIRADIYCDLLEGRHHPSRGGGGGVKITIDLPTLLGLADEPGELDGWGPVVADLARRVARQNADGTWEFEITDPTTGLPQATGVTRRRPTAGQRRHVEARDRTCTFPTCPVPAHRCHIDHTRDYHLGGPTGIENLGPLCPRHHLRTKHGAGWTLEQPSPGTFLWTSPRGHRYELRAPPD